MIEKKGQPLSSPVSRLAIVLLCAGITATLVFSLYNLLQARSAEQTPTPTFQENSPTPESSVVSALGYIEPDGEVISLSAPNSLTDGNRVSQVLVKEGDSVEAGQTIAILDSYTRRLAALEKAKTDAQTAQAQLEKIKAGSQEGDILAQEAVIARLEAEVNNAEVEYERNRFLHEQGAISASELDSKRLTVEATRGQLNEAKGTLERLREVRPVDVRVAQTEVDSAIAAVKQAQAELDLTYVRSPIAGRVLKVHTRSGETVSSEGIVEIGRTSQMYVAAEVYETDITKVQLGQAAIITSSAFPGKLQGEVSQIGLEVSKQQVFGVNPMQSTDNRVIEVKVKLDPSSSEKVAGLSNLQVEVLIGQ